MYPERSHIRELDDVMFGAHFKREVETVEMLEKEREREVDIIGYSIALPCL